MSAQKKPSVRRMISKASSDGILGPKTIQSEYFSYAELMLKESNFGFVTLCSIQAHCLCSTAG